MRFKCQEIVFANHQMLRKLLWYNHFLCVNLKRLPRNTFGSKKLLVLLKADKKNLLMWWTNTIVKSTYKKKHASRRSIINSCGTSVLDDLGQVFLSCRGEEEEEEEEEEGQHLPGAGFIKGTSSHLHLCQASLSEPITRRSRLAWRGMAWSASSGEACSLACFSPFQVHNGISFKAFSSRDGI